LNELSAELSGELSNELCGKLLRVASYELRPGRAREVQTPNSKSQTECRFRAVVLPTAGVTSDDFRMPTDEWQPTNA